MKVRRPTVLPLLPLYWAALRFKNTAYDLGLAHPRRLRAPAISVGSLAAGGAGKTPVVIMLAKLLASHGIAVDVLSRGYGRRSTATIKVDPSGTADDFGDEPLEMARAGINVYVGRSRYAAGALAESERAPAPHLLDDGFQHRQLARAVDIVLLTAEDLEDQLLPAGNLREPLASLRRAHVVLVREEEAPLLTPSIHRNTKAAVWLIRRTVSLDLEPSRPVAFCGIARPADFIRMLEAKGVSLFGTVVRPDHHRYTAADIAMIKELALHVGGSGFITTRKDAVKITASMRKELEAVGPLVIADLEVSLVEESSAWLRLQSLLHPA